MADKRFVSDEQARWAVEDLMDPKFPPGLVPGEIEARRHQLNERLLCFVAESILDGRVKITKAPKRARRKNGK